MAKNLVIVESPAKSKTIKKYLWEWFEVVASMGHVTDLSKKNMGIDIENNFQPLYEISPDKKKTVAWLKRLAKSAETVWIATDEDREWEAIGRHVANQLKLDVKKTPRIVFHEITKTAIQKAIKEPRTLDMDLVDAQQARRILDRLVGFQLSPVLWKKIKAGLSAGRVQSVAVRVIVEREREIEAFESSSSFKTVGIFKNSKENTFEATLKKTFKQEQKIFDFLELLKESDFSIENIETKPGKKSPSAPFTTSTLQQEASRKLGFSVSRTMQVAQRLYEAGLITYMRTDAVNLSDDAINQAKAVISSEFGTEYSHPTRYKGKSKGAQEAHECIRPTDMNKKSQGADASQKRLYDLILKRTLASQMAPAQLEKTKATIAISNSKENFVADGEVIKFDGFLKLYIESRDDDDNNDELKKGMLPKLEEGEAIERESITATERFKKHPPRYTEASLVKELESKGIGRPSTYAPTISTIQKRGYIVLEDRDGIQRNYQELILEKTNTITTNTKSQNTWAEKKKLFPTDIGMVVNDFLVEKFEKIIDYNFTADVEQEFDHIAEGELQRQAMIKKFYTPFKKNVEEVTWEEGRVNTERVLGKDPKTWETILVRIGRYGPMVQMGEQEDENSEKKPKYASIPQGKSISNITLEEAIDCFKLPRVVGQYEDIDVIAAIGRFWPYIKYKYSGKDIFASIKKDSWFDPISISLEDATELVKAKIEFEKNKYINEFEYNKKKIEILNGPYGPYIKYDKKNYKIPKWWKDATDLKLKDCKEIIAWGSTSKTKSTAKKKTVKKK